jgi:hypothetical protein
MQIATYSCISAKRNWHAGKLCLRRRPGRSCGEDCFLNYSSARFFSTIPPSHPDTDHVDRALDKIEQMRIEKRAHDILHHNDQANPFGEAIAAKQQQMGYSHRL